MSEGVVADDVSGLDDLAGNLRLLVDVASDQKKSCVYVVFCENFEQAQGVRVVGAVVVGECELARSGGQSGEGFSVPLRSWSHGLVACENRGCSGDDGGEG